MFWDKKARKTLSEETIRSTLGNPDWLSGVKLSENGEVTLVIEADPADMERSETRRIETETRIMSLEGVKDVKSVLTAQQQPGAAARHAHKHSAEAPVQAGQTRVRKGARLSDEAVNQGNPGGPAQIASITGISRILVVASAKGGVGKSTVSVNLAAAFAKQGLRDRKSVV